MLCDARNSKRSPFAMRTSPDGELIIPKALWAAVILAYCVILPLHTYCDILITAKQGYSLWDLLLEGKAWYFYIDSATGSGNPYYTVTYEAAYLFPVYLIFAVWNFPTWLLGKMTGASLFNTVPSMIWMKLMLVPFIVVSARQINHIVKKTGYRQYAQLAAFLFVSSILTVYPIAVIGQYDILGLPFILWGISAWIDGDFKKFLAAFACASVFKYFALLYFLPLLLLREKKIGRILLSFAAVLVPSVLLANLFPGDLGHGGNLLLIAQFLNGVILSDDTTLYVFAAAVALVLLYLYFAPFDKKDELPVMAFSLFVIFASFCILAAPLPYWVVIASPAFVFAVVFSGKNNGKLLFFETVIAWGVTLKNFILFPACFSIRTTGAMGVLHRLLGTAAPALTDDSSVLLRIHDSPILSPIVRSVLFTGLCVCFAAAACFSFPRGRRNEMWEPLNGGAVYLRTVGNIALAFLPAAYIAFHMLFR